MNTVWLGLGSNLGDRLGFLGRGLRGLAARGFIIRRISSIYETSPVGTAGQPDFLNCVAEAETFLPAAAALSAALGTERELGRTRPFSGAPRTLDIDLLFFNQELIDCPGLVIPHPRMAGRRFVLIPLAEIRPGLLHPGYGITAAELLARCPAPDRVEFYCQSKVVMDIMASDSAVTGQG